MKNIFFAFPASLLLFSGILTLPAATKYWDMDDENGYQGGDGVWDVETTANWNAGAGRTVWSAGDDAVFSVGTSKTNVISVIGDVPVNSITKGSSTHVTLTGTGRLLVGAGGISQPEAGENRVLQIDCDVILAEQQTWRTMWNTPSVLRVNGNISDEGRNLDLDFGLMENGNGGVFELFGDNAWGGATILSGANIQLRVQSPNAIGFGPIVFDGGQLEILADCTFTNDLVVTENSSLAYRKAISYVQGNLTFSGNMSGNGLLKSMSAPVNGHVLTLGGNNADFEGRVDNSTGKIVFAAPDAGSAKAVWIANDQGILLDFPGGEIHFGNLIANQGWINFKTSGKTNAFSVVIGERNEDGSYAGMIQAGKGDTLTLVKEGTGTYTLNRTQNNYNGGTIIRKGVLEATQINNDWAISSVGNIGDVTLDGGIFRYIGPGNSTSTRKIRLASNGGRLESCGELPVVFSAKTLAFPTTDIPGSRTLELGGTNTLDNTFACQLVDAAEGSVNLAKVGSGVWHFAGTKHTFTGDVTVREGSLFVDTGLTTPAVVDVCENGRLSGSGTISVPLTFSRGGCFHAASNEVLHVAGALTFAPNGGAAFTLDESGTPPGFLEVADGAPAPVVEDFMVGELSPETIAAIKAGCVLPVVRNLSGQPIERLASAPQENGIVRMLDKSTSLRIRYNGSIDANGVAQTSGGNDIVLSFHYENMPTLLLFY